MSGGEWKAGAAGVQAAVAIRRMSDNCSVSVPLILMYLKVGSSGCRW